MACSRGKKIVNMLSLNAVTTASTCENIAEDLQEIANEDAFDSDKSIRDADYIPNERSSSSESDVGVPEGTNFIEKSDDSKSGERKTSKKKCPNKWRKNIRKSNKSSGIPYINTKGYYVLGKCVKEACKNKWRLHCNAKISEQQRTEIFTSYWELSNIDRQRDFTS